jgi:hypothetical protein
MINEFIIGSKKDEKVELKDVKLIKNKYGYCLDLTYRVEDDKEIREFNIPSLRLPIDENRFVIRNEHSEYYNNYFADIGFGLRRMFGTDGCDRNPCYTIKTIETKTKEMTLDEIEKKLGHKVKIVNK